MWKTIDGNQYCLVLSMTTFTLQLQRGSYFFQYDEENDVMAPVPAAELIQLSYQQLSFLCQNNLYQYRGRA